jgi:hypothetical protein
MRLDRGQIEVVDEAMAEVLCRKTGAERLQMAFGLWRFARLMVRAGVRSRHPEWTEAEVAREVARRMLHGAA